MVQINTMNYINLKELSACIMASIPFLYIGVNSGFSTNYIYEENSEETMSDEVISWIGSSGLMLSFIGCLATGYLMDKFGRKSLFYTAYGVNFVGWMTIAGTKYFLFGRILTSIANGFGSSCPVYVAEILLPNHRGTFLNLVSTFQLFGTLCVYFAGYYVSTETISLILSICALALFFIGFLMPETPYWYMMKKQKHKAIESLVWLRDGNELMIDYEINKIEKNLWNTNEASPNFIETIFHLEWWKTFLLFSAYTILIEFTGFDIIVPYSMQFFAEFNQVCINGKLLSVIFLVVAFVGSITTAFITEKFYRTSLVKNTHLVNTVLLIISGFCELYFHSVIISIISIICLCIYAATVTITVYSLPTTIISESLSTESRGTIFAALGAESAVINYLAVLIFPTLLRAISVSYILWLFAVVAIANCVFVHYCLKETKDTILPGSRSVHG